MLVVLLLAAVLATYRLSRAISQEAGPFDLFDRLRNLFLGNNWMAEGIRCLYCVSFWVGLSWGIYLGWRGLIEWIDVPLLGMAFSGGAIILDKYWRRT